MGRGPTLRFLGDVKGVVPREMVKSFAEVSAKAAAQR